MYRCPAYPGRSLHQVAAKMLTASSSGAQSSENAEWVLRVSRLKGNVIQVDMRDETKQNEGARLVFKVLNLDCLNCEDTRVFSYPFKGSGNDYCKHMRYFLKDVLRVDKEFLTERGGNFVLNERMMGNLPTELQFSDIVQNLQSPCFVCGEKHLHGVEPNSYCPRCLAPFHLECRTGSTICCKCGKTWEISKGYLSATKEMEAYDARVSFLISAGVAAKSAVMFLRDDTDFWLKQENYTVLCAFVDKYGTPASRADLERTYSMFALDIIEEVMRNAPPMNKLGEEILGACMRRVQLDSGEKKSKVEGPVLFMQTAFSEIGDLQKATLFQKLEALERTIRKLAYLAPQKPAETELHEFGYVRRQIISDLDKEVNAEEFAYNMFRSSFIALQNASFARYLHPYVVCSCLSGMGKTRFGRELLGQMREIAKNANSDDLFAELVQHRSQYVFVEFNGSGNGWTQMDDLLRTMSPDKAGWLMGLRLFLSARLKLPVDKFYPLISAKEVDSFCDTFRVPLQVYNVLPYLGSQLRLEKGFMAEDLVMLYVHVDEFQMLPKNGNICGDMIRPFGHYVTNGVDASPSRNDRVFVLPLLTGTKRLKLADALEAMMPTGRKIKEFNLLPLSEEVTMDLLLDDKISVLYQLSKREKDAWRENPLFQIFARDLSGVPRFVDRAAGCSLSIDDKADADIVYINSASDVVKSFRTGYISNIQACVPDNLRITLMQAVISGVPMSNKTKFGNTSLETLEHYGVLEVVDDNGKAGLHGRIRMPTPVLAALNGIVFPVLQVTGDAFENAVMNAEIARQRIFRYLKKKKVRIGELFPGAKCSDSGLLKMEVRTPNDLEFVENADLSNITSANASDTCLYKAKPNNEGFDAYRIFRSTDKKRKPYLFFFQMKGMEDPLDSSTVGYQRYREEFEEKMDRLLQSTDLYSKFEVIYLYIQMHRMSEDTILAESAKSGHKTIVVSNKELTSYIPYAAHRLGFGVLPERVPRSSTKRPLSPSSTASMSTKKR